MIIINLMEDSNGKESYIVETDETWLRLDEFMHRKEESLPMAAVRRAIEEGDVLVNGRARSSGWRLKEGDRISAAMAEHRHRSLEVEDIKLEIIYEDDHLIAINKPPFMLSHPTVKERSGTLINALMHHFKKDPIASRDSLRPMLVHRLDRDTSGVIVAAKRERSLQKLFHQFNERRVKKTYAAVVFGIPSPQSGLISASIGRHPALWPRWRVMEQEGKHAETKYSIKELAGTFSLMELEPQTGRTHQLRIHMAHIGHPIVGDHTYGRELNKRLQQEQPELSASRQLLHASSLSLRHPITNDVLELTATLPEDMQVFLKKLKN